jgi:acetyl-CoA carboxylase carboxyl transferase subunit beta
VIGFLDAGTFRSWDGPLPRVPATGEYAAELARSRAATGRDESALAGQGLVNGHPVAVIACDFAFLGGSIGIAAGERLTEAVERATAERLPLVALPASGGTRMQEGAVAFLQMVKISSAVIAHKAAGLPYIVYLRHPTTGGVYASWGSLGHITLAEPGALIGFLGPRVYRALHGEPFPEGVQTAENLRDHGIVDAVVPLASLPGYLDQILTALTPVAGHRPRQPSPPTSPVLAWESVMCTRDPDRIGTAELARLICSPAVSLGNAGMVLALGRVGGYPCVLLGHDRHAAPPGPAALGLARRALRLAAELGVPLITVIDTPGAELSVEAEEGGLAPEIAWCIADMLTVPVPTIALLLGQGTGGAALALLPADTVVATQHAWLAPLSPEGASAIIHRDLTHAPELAARQGITAAALADHGIIDEIVAEPPGKAALGLIIESSLAAHLDNLTPLGLEARITRRRARYRNL